jgi:hypothetical protein
MSVRAVGQRYLGLDMRWRVLIALAVFVVIGTITSAIADSLEKNRPGYVDGYDLGRDFYDARRPGETAGDYCRRLTWEAGPLRFTPEYIDDFHVGCEDAATAG